MRCFRIAVMVVVCFAASRGALLFGACPDREHLFGDRRVYTLPYEETETVGANAHVLCVGDYNGDGIIDAGVVNRHSYQLCVLFGNADGTFQDAVPYRLPLDSTSQYGSLYEGMCQGDLDGDGTIDLVGVDFCGQKLAILFNDGHGVFGTPVLLRTGAGKLFPHGAHARDMDGDDDLDLVVTMDDFGYNIGGSVFIYKNDGRGNFTLFATVPTSGKRPQNVGVGDFDGDGDLDYAAANSEWVGAGSAPNVTVFRNSGNGTMAYQRTIRTPDTTAPCSCEAVDLDHDGALDLVVGSWTDNTVCVLWGDGAGGFSTPQLLLAPDTSTAVEPAIADLDQDGNLDIVMALFGDLCSGGGTWWNKVAIFWGDGARGFSATPTLLVNQGLNTRFPAVADFDRDGDPDIGVITWCSGTFEVFMNQCPGVTLFKRGDPNGDRQSDIADAVSILGYLFASKPAPKCMDGVDINDDGTVNIADAIALLGYLFASKPAPPAPFTDCGDDGTDDTLTCDAFPQCQ